MSETGFLSLVLISPAGVTGCSVSSTHLFLLHVCGVTDVHCCMHICIMGVLEIWTWVLVLSLCGSAPQTEASPASAHSSLEGFLVAELALCIFWSFLRCIICSFSSCS